MNVIKNVILDHFKNSVFQKRKNFERLSGAIMLGDCNWTGARLRYLVISYKENYIEMGYTGGELPNNVHSIHPFKINETVVKNLPTTIKDFDVYMKKLNIEQSIKDGADTIVQNQTEAKVLSLN